MPKNGERRNVPLNAVLTSTLKAVKMESTQGEAVFRTPQGKPYRNFRTAFERAVVQAGLEDFTFHDLRHTFASRLVMRDVDLPTVKELLGHKSIAMTLRNVHLLIDHKRRAVQHAGAVWPRSPHKFPHSTPASYWRELHK